jgi:prenylated cyclic peptide (anacyclamide/piricyclamide family)
MTNDQMTKKNIKPQQAAPVQREINTTASEGGTTGLTPSSWGQGPAYPFAGDDAE